MIDSGPMTQDCLGGRYTGANCDDYGAFFHLLKQKKKYFAGKLLANTIVKTQDMVKSIFIYVEVPRVIDH